MASDREPPILAFVDLETSGQNASLHEVLEAACVLVDPLTGETVGRPGADAWSATIDPAQGDWPDRMPEVVRDMHTESGLLRDVTVMGVHRGVAERSLCAWLIKHRPGNRPFWLAGGGVALFETSWLPRHLPTVASLVMNYSAGCRLIDVSATRRHLELAGVRCPDFSGSKPHRALPDVWVHVAEYRWQRSVFGRLAAAPDVVSGVPVPTPTP